MNWPLQFCIGAYSFACAAGWVLEILSNSESARKGLQNKGQNGVHRVKTGRIRMMTRMFVKSGKVVLFVALVAEIGLAAGCRRRAAGASDYNDPHPLPAEPLVVDAPAVGRHGGRFVMGSIQNPRTFNAIMANEQSSNDIVERMFARLTDYDNAAQKLTPYLAKSWEMAPDGLTWTFHLRKGAKFSDGHPITSEDVLFSFQVVYDKTLHPSAQDLLIMGGKPFEVTAPDPYTVVVKTPSPHAALVECVAIVPIMPKHVLEESYKKGDFAAAYNVSTPPDKVVTSGPWRVAQYVPAKRPSSAEIPTTSASTRKTSDFRISTKSSFSSFPTSMLPI